MAMIYQALSVNGPGGKQLFFTCSSVIDYRYVQAKAKAVHDIYQKKTRKQPFAAYLWSQRCVRTSTR